MRSRQALAYMEPLMRLPYSILPAEPSEPFSDIGQYNRTIRILHLSPPRVRRGLNAGQASLFHALLSLEASPPSPSHQLTELTQPCSGSLGAWWQLPDAENDTTTDDCLKEVTQIWCVVPSLDSSVPSNTLSFVLQCCEFCTRSPADMY